MTLVPLRSLPLPSLASTSPTDASWCRDWATRGRCAGQDPDALFVEGKEQRAAKALCKGCPVIAECLADVAAGLTTEPLPAR